MITYLILDKSNKIVAEKDTLDEAISYVLSRPFLRYESFELPKEKVSCDLDDILISDEHERVGDYLTYEEAELACLNKLIELAKIKS
jgi:hypothetical protein